MRFATILSFRRARGPGTSAPIIPTRSGVVRPLSELWPKGRAPRSIGWAIGLVQMLGVGPVSGGLRLAWSEAHQLRLALGEHDGWLETENLICRRAERG